MIRARWRSVMVAFGDRGARVKYVLLCDVEPGQSYGCQPKIWKCACWFGLHRRWMHDGERVSEGPHTELLIVGDTFGLWELTLVEGIEKLDHIITAHQAIFDQLRATGARIKVTMMVGNHDYDLACNLDFAVQLKV